MCTFHCFGSGQGQVAGLCEDGIKVCSVEAVGTFNSWSTDNLSRSVPWQ